MGFVRFVSSTLNIMKWKATILYLGVKVVKQRLIIAKCFVEIVMQRKRININLTYD